MGSFLLRNVHGYIIASPITPELYAATLEPHAVHGAPLYGRDHRSKWATQEREGTETAAWRSNPAAPPPIVLHTCVKRWLSTHIPLRRSHLSGRDVRREFLP